MAARITEGTRVRALYPNARLGTGTVTAVTDRPKFKALTVRLDADGRVAYFTPDQVEPVAEGEVRP